MSGSNLAPSFSLTLKIRQGQTTLITMHCSVMVADFSHEIFHRKICGDGHIGSRICQCLVINQLLMKNHPCDENSDFFTKSPVLYCKTVAF